MESDCLKVITTLNHTLSDVSASIQFPMVRFIHANRLCNGVAHYLAKFALSSGNNLVWFEQPLIIIQKLLFQDLCTLHECD